MRFASAAFPVIVLFTGCNLAFGQAPAQRAWDILEKGHDSHSTKERLNAVRALVLLPRNTHALELAEQAIFDKKPDVRAEAALTLGPLDSPHSIPLLKEVLKDKNVRVAFAASSALVSVGDSSGYVIYRDVLVGKAQERGRARCGGRAAPQRSKALSLMMLGVAAGFAPYAGYAWTGFKVLSKDYTGPVRVEAAQKLATERDPETELTLVKAASNRSWKVRVAALYALA